LLHPQVDEDLDDVEQKAFDGQQYHPNAGSRRLRSHELISNIWPEKPPQGRLHVLVHVATGMGNQALPASNSEYFISLLPQLRISDKRAA